MGIYRFQNTSIRKYRVSRKIQGKEKSFYFARTKAGYTKAVAKDAELKTLQDKTRQIGSGKRAFREQANKRFPTGVVNITLAVDRTGIPAFRLIVMLDQYEPPITCQRSILKHGWEGAWKAVCKRLYKAKGLRGRHPKVPCIKAAKRYLRSIGVERQYLRWAN